MKNNFKITLFSAIFLIFSVFTFAQNATIKGIVTDTEGNPIFNAMVTLEGKNLGSTSSESGSFEIKNIQPGTYNLVCKYFGLETFTENVVLAPNQVLEKNITLSKSKALEEVVVIGYGTTRTKDLTGSAVVINEKNFAQGSMSTP